MDYFSDLSFVCYGSLRNVRTMSLNRTFEGYYGIQFIRGGEIHVECDGITPWDDTGPLLFLTAPDRTFSYYTRGGPLDHLYICFRGERVKRYMESGLLPSDPGKKIIITAPDELFSVMESAIRLLRRGASRPENHGKAVLLLEKALLLIRYQPPLCEGDTCRRDSLRKLAERIAEHPEEKWDFQKESAELNLSEVHFRRLFQQENGMSPLRFVLDRRIKAAELLLASTNMLIKEIAFECGFGGEFYFSRQFRKWKKISPTEYRRQCLAGEYGTEEKD